MGHFCFAIDLRSVLFVMVCKALEAQRSDFFECTCISDTDTSFSYLSLVDKFTYILRAVRNCNLIGKHLFNLYKSRLQLLTVCNSVAKYFSFL